MRLKPALSWFAALVGLAGVAGVVGVFGLTGVRLAGAASLPDSGAQTLSCAEDATVALSTGVVVNNMWNKASAPLGPWRQCLQSRVKEGRTDHGWYWEWPRRHGIYAYPELLVGRSPWGKAPSNDARFPRSLRDTRSLQVSFDTEIHHDGDINLALEFWLTDAPPAAGKADPQSIKAELMIWSYATAGMAGDSKEKPIATAHIEGVDWQVYAKPASITAADGAQGRWLLLIYVATQPSFSARYDARKFFDDAIARKLIEPGYYISTIELGNELVSGSGSTWIKQFGVEVQ